MNIFKFAALAVVLGGLTLWLGSGIQSVENENSKEDVLGNTIDAAHKAAGSLKW
jgi:hypothetical protein